MDAQNEEKKWHCRVQHRSLNRSVAVHTAEKNHLTKWASLKILLDITY